MARRCTSRPAWVWPCCRPTPPTPTTWSARPIRPSTKPSAPAGTAWRSSRYTDAPSPRTVTRTPRRSTRGCSSPIAEAVEPAVPAADVDAPVPQHRRGLDPAAAEELVGLLHGHRPVRAVAIGAGQRPGGALLRARKVKVIQPHALVIRGGDQRVAEKNRRRDAATVPDTRDRDRRLKPGLEVRSLHRLPRHRVLRQHVEVAVDGVERRQGGQAATGVVLVIDGTGADEAALPLAHVPLAGRKEPLRRLCRRPGRVQAQHPAMTLDVLLLDGDQELSAPGGHGRAV